MPIQTPNRILIVKLSAIGDVLMATPVAKALRAAFPESHIAWIVENKSADVVLGNPHLDEVIVWDRNKGGNVLASAARFTKGLFGLRRKLRSRRFDVCVDLQGLLRSGVVCVASGARRRIGYSDAAEGSAHLYHEKHDPGGEEVNAQQRNLDILKTLGVESTDTAMYMPIEDRDREFADDFFNRENLADKRTVAFLPATTWVNKHWTSDGWSGVADLIGEKYDAKPLILGSKADVALAQRIADGARCKPVISAGQTTLKQAGALMKKSTAVIGVDTGLLHMAVALDKPVVGLFGASAWRCFLKKDNFVWVAKDFPCSPCRRHPICKNIDCMEAITPQDVDDAVRPWLE